MLSPPRLSRHGPGGREGLAGDRQDAGVGFDQALRTQPGALERDARHDDRQCSTLFDSIPHLTRSSLHLCLQCHGISRLSDVDGDKPKRSKFKVYPIGYFHIDIAQVSTEQGKLHLFGAIDRTSMFAFVQLREKATQRIGAAFLHDLVAAVPYTIHTVLTDNGIQFTDKRPGDEEAEVKAAAFWETQDRPRIDR